MNRFCFPKLTPNEIDKTNYKTITDDDGVEYIEIQALNDLKEESQNSVINYSIVDVDRLVLWTQDLYQTWYAIAGSVLWSLILSLVYLLIVRCCAGVIVYSALILILGIFVALGVFFMKKADKYTAVEDKVYKRAMQALQWICFAFGLIWLIFIICMCNKIRLAVCLLEVTAKYIHQTCSILVVPFLMLAITVAWYAYWVILSVYLYSTGTLDESKSKVIADITWDKKTRYAWWFHLFALFYVNEFIKALSCFVYASAACIWYFTHEKGSDERPVCTSFKRAFRYHLGSLAFGSLIIAIIRFLMVVLEYVKKKVDKALTEKTKQGKCYKCIICCCQCCMECIARTMEFINKHAYCEIALRGESFCKAAFSGFALVIKNLGRFSVMFLIGGFFNFLGTIFIAAASGLIGYLLITEVRYFSDKIDSPILPVFCMVMIGMVIGYVCMSTFGTSADALMHAFLYDEEINKGQPKNFPELQKFMEDER